MIGAEHQMLQVDLAIYHFNICLKDVVLLIQEVYFDNKLYDKLSKNHRFKEVYAFERWKFSELVLFSYKSRNFLNLCKKLKSQYVNITFFSCHYSDDSTLLFLSILNPLKFYVMDEGTASFTVFVRRRRFELSFGLKLVLKSVFYIKFLRIPKKVVYFTRFNLGPNFPDEVILYCIPKVVNELVSFNNSFAFLGSSVVELGIMDVYDYMFYLEQVKRDNQDSELIYYKHRKEDESKLSLIDALGYQVKDIGGPFEIFFASQTKVPNKMGSFFTTSALLNISDCFENVPTLLLYIFPIKKLRKNKKVFEYILNCFKSYQNIKIIQLRELHE